MMDKSVEHVNRIKTKLKFVKSDRSNAYVGFVTRTPENGKYMGVRQESEKPKKVCVVSKDLESYIEENVLYDVAMIPMKDKPGYIVVAAEPHAFPACVEVSMVKNAVYRVEVKFGNKTILFDPMDGVKDSVRTMNGVIELLESRKDIKDPISVIDAFTKAANIVIANYKSDGHYCSKKYENEGKAAAKA